MLVQAMNHAEIAAQIYREYDKIYSTTVQRLLNEYDRERRKFKIDKTRMYTKHYAIKTAGKNNWIIFIGKAPSREKYTGTQCTNACCMVYYYTAKGLRVFVPSSKIIFLAYNGHLFKRYNERLNLNLTGTLEAAIHHFTYNGYMHPHVIEKNGELYVIGFCKDGFLLGQIAYNNTWLVWKTFVSRDLAKINQDEMEQQLIDELRDYIETEIRKETIDAMKLGIMQDKIKGITGVLRQ